MPYRELKDKLDNILHPLGLEVHNFKIGDYNAVVQPKFHLPYDKDTLAFVVLSQPNYFDVGFLPYLQLKGFTEASVPRDALDQSVTFYLNEAMKTFEHSSDINIIHDFEMQPGTRRPRVLMQTAGHVSGATYFYQRKDVSPDPWPEQKSIFGVCIHPRYIGWFALRAVLVFKNVLVPDLVPDPPTDLLQDYELKKELLERYNERWHDWTFRDILPPLQRYSELQKRYFSTKPGDRIPLLREICAELTENRVSNSENPASEESS